MKKLLFVIMAASLVATAGYGGEFSGDFPFSKIEQRDGKIRLRFPDHGSRWLMGLNTESPENLRRSNYSEEIELKVPAGIEGDRLYLVDKHQKIMVEPVFKGQKLLLKKIVRTDLRSMGGTVSTKEFLVPVSEGAQERQPFLKSYRMALKFHHVDGDQRTWSFLLEGEEFRTLEDLKAHIRTLPKGSAIEWAPGCGRFGDEPILSSEEERQAFKKFCNDNGITLVIIPSG